MDPNGAQPETDIDKVPIATLEAWGGQWRTLYEHKRRLHDVSAKQIIWGQIFTLAVAMTISTFLEVQKEALLVIGTTLVLYPALADMLSSNAAVLSISVHHDIENLTGSKFWPILVALLRTMFVAVAASLFLGVLGGIIGVLFFDTAFLQTLLLASLSGALTGLIGLPIMLVATLLVRQLQANPDDVTAPLETTIFSTLTFVAIILVSRYIL